jgi:hypothetical protein
MIFFKQRDSWSRRFSPKTLDKTRAAENVLRCSLPDLSEQFQLCNMPQHDEELSDGRWQSRWNDTLIFLRRCAPDLNTMPS